MNRIAFWIVTAQYRGQAEQSRVSVAQCMPDIGMVIYNAADYGTVHRDWYIESIRVLGEVLGELPADALLLWLDADTYMVEPVPELFRMMERFDLVMAHAPGHRTAPTVAEVPECFPEFNIGVIGMQNTEKVRSLWAFVHQLQLKHPDIYGDNDQSPLREALWERDVSIGVMPWEYNCRFGIGYYLRDPVKILHGKARSAYEYDEIAKYLDMQTRQRWGERRYG